MNSILRPALRAAFLPSSLVKRIRHGLFVRWLFYMYIILLIGDVFKEQIPCLIKKSSLF